jgi:hypothetical protein
MREMVFLLIAFVPPQQMLFGTADVILGGAISAYRMRPFLNSEIRRDRAGAQSPNQIECAPPAAGK